MSTQLSSQYITYSNKDPSDSNLYFQFACDPVPSWAIGIQQLINESFSYVDVYPAFTASPDEFREFIREEVDELDYVEEVIELMQSKSCALHYAFTKYNKRINKG